MIKPLLRILPSLSGNVKLACMLTDVKQTGNDTRQWESNIRGARLLPISSHLWEKNIEANMISSSWEFDLPRYYRAYSDIFYKSCFDYDKVDMMKIDYHHEQPIRATDFEFGVKRISYGANGKQFAFFAPIYIDNANDIPGYFLINVKLYSKNTAGETVYAVKKSIRVNIGINGASKKNYIYRYLNSYLSKIDNNVAFCTPLTNQATYYGIDLVRSGFVTAVDNMMERIYRKQNTIQNFDATIAKAFERNKIAMKQIMPLCFYFSVDDILTDSEKIRYRNCKVEFDGAYYDMYGEKIGMYDFMHDYMQYAEEVLVMNPMTGSLQWSAGLESNLMDVIFPSLNDARYIEYEFANKLAPWFCRWKLKYTDDDHPYIINNSWAFSKNQDSNYRYSQFPSTFHYLPSLANYSVFDEKYNYNLMLPIGDITSRTSGRALYAYAPYWKTDPETGEGIPGPYNYIIDRYRRIIENYCSNWFSVVNEYTPSIFNDELLWRNTEDGCVYYDGILYDLRNVYDMGTSGEVIDKFAVILQPILKTFSGEELQNLRFSQYTLNRQAISQIADPNVVANDSLMTFSYIQSQANYLYDNDDFDYGTKVNQDELKFGEIFKKATDNDGRYIDATNTAYSVEIDGHTAYGRLDLDYYELNRYYAASDVEKLSNIINDVLNYEWSQEDYEMRQMISSYVEPYYGEHGTTKIPTDVITYGYLFTPIYRYENIAYDNLNDEDVENWQSYNTMNVDLYRITHNNSIIGLTPSYAGREYTYTYDGIEQTATLFDIMGQHSYVRHSADAPMYMMKSRIDGAWNGDYKYSYLSMINDDYINTNYGVQHYFSSYFVKSTYIPYLDPAFNAYAYLVEQTYPDDYESLSNHTYMFDWKNMREEHPAAYWAGRIIDWKRRVANNIYNRIYNNAENVQEYEYVPVLQQSGNILAKNVFQERSSWSGHFYGDAIPQSKVNVDNDVLWADPYNLSYVYSYEGKTIPQKTVYKDMYVKFLNKLHLFYWYVELFKDKDKKYNGSDDYNKFLQDEWYKYLYVVEKKMVYDYGYNATPQMKLIYTPLEKLLQFPEYYKVADEITSYAYYVANDPYRSFIAFYNHLQYEPTEDFFTLPGFFNYSMAPMAVLNWVDEVETSYIDDEVTGYTFRNERIQAMRDKCIYGHRYEEMSYSYIGDDGETYGHYEPIKFELVYRKKMMRVDESLWDITHMDDNIDNYRDIYFYRLQSDIDHDIKYNHHKKIQLQSDISYMLEDLEEIKSYTYIEITKDIHIEDGHAVIVDAYNYSYAYYDEPRVLTDNGWSYIQQSDSLLVPLFDDIFLQPSTEALVYTHYSLHDISKSSVVSDIPNAETGIFDSIMTNYRYNRQDKLMLVDVSDEERKKYCFTETYNKYNECYSELVVKDDDLGFGKFGLSTKVVDGVKYGFYYINSYINNTSNTFNMTGIANKDVVHGIKFINYINGVNVEQNPEYIAAIYKQLLPFINQQPLSAMSDVTAIIYPKTYPIDLIYSQIPENTNNGSHESTIIRNDNKLRTMSLLRYFHAMTPLIVPTYVINNEWRLKLKDVNGSMLDTGRYLSIGDAPIYSETLHINNFKPYNVYTTSYNQLEVKNYNNISSYYTPLEYKYYNSSVAINLEPHFEIRLPGKMTYEELKKQETDENVFNLFMERLNGRSRTRFNKDEILFLLNKYAVSYNSVPAGLNMKRTEKLYTLSIVFDLI